MTERAEAAMVSQVRRSERRALSRRKRCLFSVLTAVLVYAVIEGSAWLVLYFRAGGATEVASSLRAATVNDRAGVDIDPKFEVLHPYLGYVMHIRNNEFEVQGTRKFKVTEYGLYDAASPIRHRSHDKVLVGITGGSVANHFSVLSSDALAAALQPRFPGKKIEFVRLALGGFKQPQQLMALNYVLALGGELDILINIDGFNEICLPVEENIDNGVFAAFPRSWNLRVVAGNDMQLLRQIGYIAYCREERRSLAQSYRPWAWSPCALTIWNFRNNRVEGRISNSQRAVAQMARRDLDFCAHGPAQSFTSKEEMYSHLAGIWRDCSVQLHRICSANEIEYYHFLQPNRHYPRIDPTDQYEIQKAVIPQRVERGYPYLIRTSGSLREEGVNYYDLTSVFGSDTTMYYDSCHIGQSGNDKLAERVGHIIAQQQPQSD